MAKKGSKKKSGVEPFEDEINDEEMEDDKLATKNKNRRQRIEAEAEAEEDEVEAEDEAEDAEEDEDEEDAEEVDEDDDEEEEAAEPVDLGFAPFIIHDEADWTLEDVIDEAEPGQDIYFYRAPADEETPAKWYKLQAVEVGEK